MKTPCRSPFLLIDSNHLYQILHFSWNIALFVTIIRTSSKFTSVSARRWNILSVSQEKSIHWILPYSTVLPSKWIFSLVKLIPIQGGASILQTILTRNYMHYANILWGVAGKFDINQKWLLYKIHFCKLWFQRTKITKLALRSKNIDLFPKGVIIMNQYCIANFHSITNAVHSIVADGDYRMGENSYLSISTQFMLRKIIFILLSFLNVLSCESVRLEIQKCPVKS